MFDMKVETRGDVSIIELPHDFANFVQYEQVMQLWKTMETLLFSGRKRIILDMSNVRFINSTAIGGLASAYTKSRMHNATIAIVAGSWGQAVNMLKTSTLTNLINIYESTDSALVALRMNLVR